nr:MAG TPA: hypothetical protein [Caudoviricetes sp.]
MNTKYRVKKYYEMSELPKIFKDFPDNYNVLCYISYAENVNICIYITDLYESVEATYVFDFKSNKFVLNDNIDSFYGITFLEIQHLIHYIYKELNIKYKSENAQYINYKSILDNYIEIKNLSSNDKFTEEIEQSESKFNQDFTLTKSWQDIAFDLDYKNLVCRARISLKLKKIYFNFSNRRNYNFHCATKDIPKEILYSKFIKELDKNIKYYNNTVNSAQKYIDKINIINKLLIDNFPDYLI